jgi:hypothetical protein
MRYFCISFSVPFQKCQNMFSPVYKNPYFTQYVDNLGNSYRGQEGAE